MPHYKLEEFNTGFLKDEPCSPNHSNVPTSAAGKRALQKPHPESTEDFSQSNGNERNGNRVTDKTCSSEHQYSSSEPFLPTLAVQHEEGFP